jgi:hypothetical protein
MLLAASCLWAGAVLADPPKGYPFVGFDAGLKAARASGKPIFLYFGRYGCAWCDHTNKKTFSDAALKSCTAKTTCWCMSTPNRASG